jgi:phosphoglycolate phosphatase-like HAD superfamily hydrolase
MHTRFEQRRRAARRGAAEPLRVIFDPESLLLDPRPGILGSMHAALQELGVAVPEGWFERRGTQPQPFREVLAELMGTRDPRLLEQGSSRYFAHYNENGRFRGTWLPGSLRLVADLAGDGGLDMHYLTHVGADIAQRMLESYGLKHIPRSIITPEKPACPGIRLQLIRHLVEHSDAPPESWRLLSDHPWELMAARRLSVPAVALAYGRASLRSLCQARPVAIAASPAEVCGLLPQASCDAGAAACQLH